MELTGLQLVTEYVDGKITWLDALERLVELDWPKAVRPKPSGPRTVQDWNDADDDAFMPFAKGSLGETMVKLPLDKASELNNALYRRSTERSWQPEWTVKTHYYLIREGYTHGWQGAAVSFDADGGFAFYGFFGGNWMQDNTLASVFWGGDGEIVETTAFRAEYGHLHEAD